MQFLVDTHALIWFADGDSRLPAGARTLIEEKSNVAYVSLISVWELAIKESIGKLGLATPVDQYLQQALASFTLLPMTYAHALATAKLPFHHRDPFDRMLIAQSQVDQLPIVSHDKQFDAYGVERWWDNLSPKQAP